MATMTISKALRQIKKLKGQIADVTSRMMATTSFREDQLPDFDYATLRTERSTSVLELVALKAAVAKANALATIRYNDKDVTVTEGIYILSELKAEAELLSQFNLRHGLEKEYVGRSTDGTPTYNSYNWTAVMTEQERVDALAALRQEIDNLNDALETSNHIVKI
jgi:hypothetical protein